MLRRARSGWLLRVGLLVLVCWSGPSTGLADDPAPSPRPPAALPTADDGLRAVVPLPLPTIPDNPPPHEGALIDIPLVIEPPDILVVEVLEALPGRPISGERLVRPDGTISLGFYGHVHVRGLTLDQAKVKIIHHLRHQLADATLGLVYFKVEEGPVGGPPQPTNIPKGEPATVVPDPDPKNPVQSVPAKPQTEATPKTSRASRRANRRSKRAKTISQVTKPQEPAHQQPAQPEAPRNVEEPGLSEVMVFVEPVLSNRVFVDITSHNTKHYYVQGNVGTPGRIPHTGKDTILDALNYAGGLIPTAEPTDIHLYRPAWGSKPARDYLINREAIFKGDAQANLQLFPNDRLVIGRNAIVKKTMEIDRASASVNSLIRSVSQEAGTFRTARGANPVVPVDLPGWFADLWDDLYRDPELLTNPEKLRVMFSKRLDPAKPN